MYLFVCGVYVCTCVSVCLWSVFIFVVHLCVCVCIHGVCVSNGVCLNSWEDVCGAVCVCVCVCVCICDLSMCGIFLWSLWYKQSVCIFICVVCICLVFVWLCV